MISSSRNASSWARCVDEVHLQAQAAEDRRVLAADDAGAVDGERLGRRLELEDGVAVEDARVVEVHVIGAVGPAAGGDDEVVGRVPAALPAAARHLDGVGIDEAGHPHDDLDVVAAVEAPAQVDLGLDDDLRVAQQRLVVGIPELQPVGLALDDLPQGLAGDGALVGAVAAHLEHGLHHGHPLVRLGALHGGSLAAGAAADDDDVVVALHGPRFLDSGVRCGAVRRKRAAAVAFMVKAEAGLRNHRGWRGTWTTTGSMFVYNFSRHLLDVLARCPFHGSRQGRGARMLRQ